MIISKHFFFVFFCMSHCSSLLNLCGLMVIFFLYYHASIIYLLQFAPLNIHRIKLSHSENVILITISTNQHFVKSKTNSKNATTLKRGFPGWLQLAITNYFVKKTWWVLNKRNLFNQPLNAFGCIGRLKSDKICCFYFFYFVGFFHIWKEKMSGFLINQLGICSLFC